MEVRTETYQEQVALQQESEPSEVACHMRDGRASGDEDDPLLESIITLLYGSFRSIAPHRHGFPYFSAYYFFETSFLFFSSQDFHNSFFFFFNS